jgi:hypothetical protein
MNRRAKAASWLFLITFALVFYGTGASFIESFVNYPTWRLVGADEFQAFHQALSPLVIGYMVVPLMLTTVLTAALFWLRPATIPRWGIALSLGLQLIAWISTFAIQIPIQMELSNAGLSLPLIERLIVTNWWLRRVPMLINSLLFLWMMSLLLRRNEVVGRSEV